jgi:hypothetical protein
LELEAERNATPQGADDDEIRHLVAAKSGRTLTNVNAIIERKKITEPN